MRPLLAFRQGVYLRTMAETPEERRDRLRDQLNAFYTWPTAFTFKFILPHDEVRVRQLKELFGVSAEFRTNLSRNGNYIAITVTEVLPGPDYVFARYEAAGEIEGILSF